MDERIGGKNAENEGREGREEGKKGGAAATPLKHPRTEATLSEARAPAA